MRKANMTVVLTAIDSAFLLYNTYINLEHANRERCSAGFAKFIELHSALISEMKAAGISRKSCFGFIWNIQNRLRRQPFHRKLEAAPKSM